jgi:hypothetical protein
MNERIKELLEQAGVKYVTMPKDTVYEKFAELIVRECGVALSPMLRDMISRGQAFDLIKRHFGVEE